MTDMDELDENFDDEITDINKHLENEKNPTQINLQMSDKPLTDFTFGNTDNINDIYDKIKKMPRDQILKLFADMKPQLNDNNEGHNFISVSDNKREQYRNKLKKKLDLIKLKQAQQQNQLQQQLQNQLQQQNQTQCQATAEVQQIFQQSDEAIINEFNNAGKKTKKH